MAARLPESELRQARLIFRNMDSDGAGRVALTQVASLMLTTTAAKAAAAEDGSSTPSPAVLTGMAAHVSPTSEATQVLSRQLAGALRMNVADVGAPEVSFNDFLRVLSAMHQEA